MTTNIKNRGGKPVLVDAWVVMVMLVGRSPASAYLNHVLSQEIAFITEDDFDNIIGDSMPLQEWVS